MERNARNDKAEISGLECDKLSHFGCDNLSRLLVFHDEINSIRFLFKLQYFYLFSISLAAIYPPCAGFVAFHFYGKPRKCRLADSFPG